jgi:hypothetical protein
VTLMLTAAYDDKNVGTGKLVTGSYALSGADVANYDFTPGAFTGKAYITQASLSLAAAGTVAASRVYDGSTGIMIDTDGTLGGLMSGDDVMLTLTAGYDDKNVGTGKDVTGSYALSGADIANYNFAPGAFTANADITARSITVSASDQSRLQGAADPALTWTLTGGGLASVDSVGSVFSGVLTRAPGETVGDYAVGQGTLLAGANYAMGFVPGTFTITPAQYTGSQVLEQQGKDGEPPPLLSDERNDDPEGACSDGVSGAGCAAYVTAGNRDLGPYIGMTE